jgi:hypothetical protein
MTTKHSPLKQLKAQADTIAEKLKAAERGEIAVKGGARDQESVKVGVVMDDKLLTIEMAWATIKSTSEAGISEYILKQMRESRDTNN